MQEPNMINSIQASILRELSLRDEARFAEINVNGVSSDQFSYHLRQLVKYGLVEKTADNQYRLSAKGRTRTIMLHKNDDGFITQGFLAVRLVIERQQDNERQYLMQERNMVPYKGTFGTPGNKILFGEAVLEAAARILKDETNLTCALGIKGLHHIRDEYGGEFMQDKYFFICAGRSPEGELRTASHRGRLLWMTEAELNASERAIQGNAEILETTQATSFTFRELTFHVDTY